MKYHYLRLAIVPLVFLSLAAFAQTGSSDKEYISLPVPVASIAGLQAKAFLAAYQAFRFTKDIAPDKKDLRKYKVKFYETARTIDVMFVPLTGADPNLARGENENGRQVKYDVDKATFKVIHHWYYM